MFRHRRNTRASPPTSTSRLGKERAFRLNLMGDDQGSRRPRHRGEPPLRRCAVARVRPRHHDAPHAQLSPPAGRRHARLRHSVAVQRTRAGRASRITTASNTATFSAPTSTSRTAKARARRQQPDQSPQSGALRPLSRAVQITEAKVAGTLDLDTPLDDIDVTRNQIAVQQPRNISRRSARRDLQLQHRLPEAHARRRRRRRPRNVEPDAFRVERCSQHEPAESRRKPAVQRHVGDQLRRSRDLDQRRRIRRRYRQAWPPLGSDRRHRAGIASTPTTTRSRRRPGSAQFSRVDQQPSCRAAFVYKPVNYGSIYFDYGTSFNPSAETLALSAGTADLSPEKNRTYEVGTKWDLPSKRLSVDAAVFQTTKVNARETSPTNPLLVVLAGTQRVNGFQVAVTGRITESLATAFQLCLSRRQSGQLAIFPGGHRRATRERPEEHVQRVDDLQPARGASPPAPARNSSTAAPRAPPCRSIRRPAW